MPKARSMSIQFPLGGLDRTLAFQSQPPATTPACLNVWPIDVETGRGRGGVRPGLSTIGSVGGAPYAWCPAPYLDGSGVPREGIAVTYASGTRISLSGADWGSPPSITTSPGTTLSSCEVYNGYLFQARGGGTCRVKQLPAGSESDLTVSFYDPPTNAEPKGTAPTNCGIVIRHADRLFLMADTTNYHVVYASATGDHTNWDYSDITEGGAFINSGAEGGQVGHQITAAIRHSHNILLVGGPGGITAFSGNPRASGSKVVNDTFGPLSNTAWCKGIDRDGNDNTYVMTVDGLYMIPDGSLQMIKLSKRKVPNELQGRIPTLASNGNNTGTKVAIGFDNRWEAIHIYVDETLSDDVSYTYSITQDSYWPTSYASPLRLFPVFPNLQSLTKSAVYPISSGGTGYQFDTASSETLASYVIVGPIMLGDEDSEGILHSITAALAKNSDNVDWEVYAGDSVEQAYDKAIAGTSPDYQGEEWFYSAPQYFNNRQHPRVRGHSCYLKIYGANDQRWLIEDIVVRLSPAGIRRHG